MESIFKLLTRANFSPTIIYRGYHAITIHIVGFTQQQIGYQKILIPEFKVTIESFLNGLNQNCPHLAEHVLAHLNEKEECNEFIFVLNLILDGLERS